MKPVILVPGFGGSILVKKGYETYKPHIFSKPILDNRWINLKTLAVPPSKTWHDDMYYSIATQPGSSKIIGLKDLRKDIIPYDIGGTKGIKDLVPEFRYLNNSYKHKLNSIFYYRYFHDICNKLYKEGYKDHETLFGLPYDFRLVLDPNYREEIFQSFAHVIQKSVSLTGEKAVVVTHSMGGLLFKWFLTNQPYYQDFIHKWISISTPFGGSHYSLRVGLCGDHYIPLFKSTVKDELSRNTGIIMCFPNILGYHPEEPLATVLEGFTGNKDVHSHITISTYDILASHGMIQFKLWKDLYMPYFEMIQQPISVPTHIVIGINNQTKARFTMRTLNTDSIKEKMIVGDGIVSEKSLLAFEKVITKSYTRELILKENDHTSPLMNEDVIKLIINYAK